LGVTLRYPYETRKEQDYFGDLADEEVPKQMLELATHIIATKAGPFSRRNSKITTSARSAN
jgi:DNA end-binding protein Ku